MDLSRRFRVHERRAVRLSASVHHPEAGWHEEGRVTNMSLGGACVQLRCAVAEGDRVRVDFMAPSLWDPLGIRARVVWSQFANAADGARLGVAFEHADAASVLALFELICSFDFV